MNEQRPPRNETAEVWNGIGLAVLLHLLQFIFAPLTGGSSFTGIGLWQLAYELPAWVICGLIGRTGMMKGIVIAAAITFLLNTACYGFFNGLVVRH